MWLRFLKLISRSKQNRTNRGVDKSVGSKRCLYFLVDGVGGEVERDGGDWRGVGEGGRGETWFRSCWITLWR